MTHTIRALAGATFLAATLAVPAIAAEPIVGNWKTASGATAAIAKCGGAFCITLKSGKYSGKRIGKVSGSGNKYSGKITDPAEDKTYSGYATVKGSTMSMKGCVVRPFCKTQTWSRL